MMQVRRAGERGEANLGWLLSKHTFSFANYYDQEHMGFRSLKVINEDRVEPSYGFDLHSHQNVEVISYVLEGALEHKDSLGQGGILKPGDVQVISAGSGIAHSEYNPSKTESVHFLQIWLLPQARNRQPRYAQAHFLRQKKMQGWVPIASPDGRQGSLPTRQDAEILASILEPEKSLAYSLQAGRHAWLQVARGAVSLNGQVLQQGDGVAVSAEKNLNIVSQKEEAEVLLFDLP